MTLGYVAMMSMSYSRRSRSWMISMCSKPRNPQRNPNPSATELSGWNTNAASFNCNLPSAVLSFSKSAVLIG